MIGCNVNRFCSEPLHLIENFDLAMNSTETWDCHHRLEIIDGKVTSAKELIDRGLYYGRPASELIFLKHSEHTILHNKADKEKQKKLYKAAHSTEANEKRDKSMRENGGYKKAAKAGHSPEVEARRIANGSYKKAAQAAHSPEAEAKRAKKRRKPILQFTKSGEFVKEYESVKQAHIDTGINNISACARGEIKSACGFAWKYKSTLPEELGDQAAGAA